MDPPATCLRLRHEKRWRGHLILWCDRTVDPSNAEMILADARAGLSGPAHETQHDGVAGGRAYTRTVIADTSGVVHAEHWAIDGLGHAWSGGSPEGSYTDRRGPDASREMLRFFLEAPAR